MYKYLENDTDFERLVYAKYFDLEEILKIFVHISRSDRKCKIYFSNVVLDFGEHFFVHCDQVDEGFLNGE